MGGLRGYVDMWWDLPRVELRKQNFSKTFPKSGIVEAEICENIPPRVELPKQYIGKGEWQMQIFTKTFPLEWNCGS